MIAEEDTFQSSHLDKIKNNQVHLESNLNPSSLINIYWCVDMYREILQMTCFPPDDNYMYYLLVDST